MSTESEVSVLYYYVLWWWGFGLADVKLLTSTLSLTLSLIRVKT